MPEDLKKIPDILDQIAHKLGKADEEVLKPYIEQMKNTMDNIKKSGQNNLKDNLEKALDISEKVKEVKIGDLPGIGSGINMIQSILKDKISKL